MIVRRALFALALLLGIAAAADWNYAAGFSDWFGYHSTGGNDVMDRAYSTCQQYKANTEPTAGKAVCVYHLVALMFGSFAAAFGGGYIIDAVAYGVDKAKKTQAAYPPSSTQGGQSLEHDKALLDHFNRGSEPNGLQATHIVESHIYPDDGLAIRMNEIDLQRRAFVDIDGHSFKFSGIDAFKAQIHSTNHPSAQAWGTDIDDFVKHWTRSKMQPEPVLQRANAWRFEVCNKKRTATFFYGMLVAELDTPGNNYEPMDPPGCH